MLRRPLIVSVLALTLTATSCGPAAPEGLVPDGEPIARCNYRNPFSSNDECREYWGDSWSLESAAADCETDIAGGAGQFMEGEGCALPTILGTCVRLEEEGFGFTTHLGGESESECANAQLACESFARGNYIADGLCADGGSGDSQAIFIWPYETCEDPLDGEPPGQSPGDQVCTKNLISGCTEEGRDFRDYGSCDTVFTNRPYYPVEPYSVAPEDDPRLDDPEYLEELEWVTSQTRSCACVCCHSSEAPEGPSIWGIDRDLLWIDQMSDTAVGMFAGFIDSSALGAYPPEDNNGFNRTDSSLPTTDPERMVAFWRGEMERRGLTAEDMEDEPPVGAVLLDQITYELPDCEGKTRVSANGEISWTSDYNLRYLYVLEEGSLNPGLPPDMDMPEGVLWRVDVPADGQPMQSGVTYGELPPTAIQRVPADGSAPPPLERGRRYHLYGLFDVALPQERCVFEYPETGSCALAPARGSATAVFALLGLIGLRRRRQGR